MRTMQKKKKKSPAFSCNFRAAPSALLYFNMLETNQSLTSERNIINFDYNENWSILLALLSCQ